jgi:hypothetical protein
MKNTPRILIPGLFWLLFLTASAQDDKAAIKAVIEKETSSFFNLDRKAWEETWLQTPYAYWSYSDSTGTSFIEGWDVINKNFSEYFKTKIPNRQIDVAHQSNDNIAIERIWKDLRVYGTGAYAQYVQKVKDNNIHRDETSQIRILEKKNGKWKIVYVAAIAKYPEE